MLGSTGPTIYFLDIPLVTGLQLENLLLAHDYPLNSASAFHSTSQSTDVISVLF